MSKGLEKIMRLLIKLLHTNMLGNEGLQLVQEIKGEVQQALTPPTQEEVVKALEKHCKAFYEDAEVTYKETVYRDIDRLDNNILFHTIERIFTVNFFYETKTTKEITHIQVFKENLEDKTRKEVGNSMTVNNGHFSYPPHLITLIGRFYESEAHK